MVENIKPLVTVEAVINNSIENVWSFWTEPKHIVKWNSASEDWHTPIAENDLRVGGKFLSRMEAKDGSFGFDLIGTYTEVKLHELIAYVLEDGRRVEISFIPQENKTQIIEQFEAEEMNPVDLQKQGWQAILNNFKNYNQL